MNTLPGNVDNPEEEIECLYKRCVRVCAPTLHRAPKSSPFPSSAIHPPIPRRLDAAPSSPPSHAPSSPYLRAPLALSSHPASSPPALQAPSQHSRHRMLTPTIRVACLRWASHTRHRLQKQTPTQHVHTCILHGRRPCADYACYDRCARVPRPSVGDAHVVCTRLFDTAHAFSFFPLPSCRQQLEAPGPVPPLPSE